MTAKKTTSKAAPAKAATRDVETALRTPANNLATFYSVKPTLGAEKIMTEGKAKIEKLTQDATAAGKDHVEALVKSGNIFAKGFEEFLKTYTALAQSTAEKNSAAIKALLSTKTLNEFTELQSSIAQQNFDDFLSGVSKLSEIGVKLTTETLEPLNEQVSKTVKKATDSLAA